MGSRNQVFDLNRQVFARVEREPHKVVCTDYNRRA